jgi:predicted methyltransferase
VHRYFGPFLSLLLFLPFTPAYCASGADKNAIAAAIASPDRLTADREEDSWRKPQVVLEFLGARPGMTVIDVLAGGGYYTELLARTVGPTGHVIAYNNPPYAQFGADGLKKHFAQKRLKNAEQLNEAIEGLTLKPASLDGALFVMSYHDLYWRPTDGSWPPTDPHLLLEKLFTALKSGGVVVVEDHIGARGVDPTKSVNEMHRIDPEVLKGDFDRAGFRFDAGSEALRNIEDDHTKPVFDPTIRHRTDQVLMRFRKP